MTLLSLLTSISALEWAANITTVITIVYATYNRVWTWPWGIVASVLFGVLFYQSKLYAETLLQGFFIATSLWGWWQWRRRLNEPDLQISNVGLSARAMCWLSALLLGLAYAVLLLKTTDAASPWWDSVVLALSMLGQVWLMQRRINHWAVWLVVSAISVPLFVSRELYLSAVLYAFYFFNAGYGWWRWQREMTSAV